MATIIEIQQREENIFAMKPYECMRRKTETRKEADCFKKKEYIAGNQSEKGFRQQSK
jgi:hypothetical protein